MSVMDNELSVMPPVTMRMYAGVLHAFPWLQSGLTRLSFNRMTNWAFAKCHEPVMATMRNGIRIEVAPSDYHGRILYLFGTNDPKVQRTAQGLLREGDVFLDIGANYSSIGLAASEWVGSTGRVHLFEPQEWICEPVEAAIRRARLENVELHRVALLDRDDEMTISRPRNHSGMATLIDDGRVNQNWVRQTVPVKNIATYVGPLIHGRPFGVKLDIEGAEPAVMPWLLAQPNLQFLIFEAAHNHDQLWELVRSAGLTPFGLCRNLFRTRVMPITTPAGIRRYHDVVAVRLPTLKHVDGETTAKALGKLLDRGELVPC